jgi:hypothetical protein
MARHRNANIHLVYAALREQGTGSLLDPLGDALEARD